MAPHVFVELAAWDAWEPLHNVVYQYAPRPQELGLEEPYEFRWDKLEMLRMPYIFLGEAAEVLSTRPDWEALNKIFIEEWNDVFHDAVESDLYLTFNEIRTGPPPDRWRDVGTVDASAVMATFTASEKVKVLRKRIMVRSVREGVASLSHSELNREWEPYVKVGTIRRGSGKYAPCATNFTPRVLKTPTNLEPPQYVRLLGPYINFDHFGYRWYKANARQAGGCGDAKQERLCMFFQGGWCKNGRACRFKH